MRTFIHTILLIILYLQGLAMFGERCQYSICSSPFVCNNALCSCPNQESHYFDLRVQRCKLKDFVSIAKGKPTSMSAPPYIQDAYSWKANDGNYWSKNAKCAYPHINTFPRWWKVNLLAYYEIHRVIMYSNHPGPFRLVTVEVLSGSKVLFCDITPVEKHVYRIATCASNAVGKEVRISTGYRFILCEVDIDGTLANPYKANCLTDIKPEECITPLNCSVDGFCDCESPATQFYARKSNTCIERKTYKENCSLIPEDSTCYNKMVCVSGICDCEIPAMQYYDPYDTSCKAKRTYKENCSTLPEDSTCLNDMICAAGICGCPIPDMQYHDPYNKSCKARGKYKESCYTIEDGSTCYSNMICVNGVCGCNATQYHNPHVHSCNTTGRYLDPCSTAVRNTSCYPPLFCSSSVCHCELPAMYYDANDNTCNVGGKYKESCYTIEDGSTCYSNMICVNGVCGCNATQYHNPNVHSCNTTGRYLDPCSTAARNTSCYPPLICSSSVCHCELPAMMHYDAGANTCNDASFNAEEFVNDTEGFGDIVGATIDSIHHMHIEIEEKEHIIEEMVTVLAVLPTENEAEMENVLEASNQISKEADALSDNVQDALLNVMDKISDKISHTDVNKSEPGKVENMVKSLFDSSSNLLDLNHVPERHIVKEKVIVEDKSETEDVIHVEETEPEQEVPYESPEEQQETQVQETEAEIKAREKKIERTKKLLHTVDIIADSALKTLSDDEPKTMEFSTKTMNLVVGVSKLNNSTNTSTDISTSRKIGNKTVTSSFKLPPEIKEQLKEASKNGFKFQMLFSDKNPRSWDKSSAYINSPMISLILKDLNQKTLGVTKLPKPIIIDIPIGSKNL
ncbi:uncharacterized protein LOC143084329 [Mytilus galloprovincialis]|uniref:uncharacterized protein LOC143084329 n=1 Tax=Mytilus galloprovincialis TaxID=29158 RepID=UPI003F7B5031